MSKPLNARDLVGVTLKVASVKSKLIANAFDTVRAAFGQRAISSEDALKWIEEEGLWHLVRNRPPNQECLTCGCKPCESPSFCHSCRVQDFRRWRNKPDRIVPFAKPAKQINNLVKLSDERKRHLKQVAQLRRQCEAMWELIHRDHSRAEELRQKAMQILKPKLDALNRPRNSGEQTIDHIIRSAKMGFYPFEKKYMNK
jgi:hypothetical protein